MTDTDYTSLPPIYRERAAKRARLAIATGAFLAVLSAAVFAFLLFAVSAEDRDWFILLWMLVCVAAGVWGVIFGLGMRRRNRAG